MNLTKHLSTYTKKKKNHPNYSNIINEVQYFQNNVIVQNNYVIVHEGPRFFQKIIGFAWHVLPNAAWASINTTSRIWNFEPFLVGLGQLMLVYKTTTIMINDKYINISNIEIEQCYHSTSCKLRAVLMHWLGVTYFKQSLTTNLIGYKHNLKDSFKLVWS